MQTCEKCGIKVQGSHKLCPLCQGILSGTPSTDEDVFPILPTMLQKHHTLIRILIFISAVAVILCFAANYLMPMPGFWSLFVAVGVVYMWVSMTFALRKRHNIPKNILWQAVIFSLFSILSDVLSGWHRWSLEFAVPCFLLVGILAMWCIAGIFRLKTENYLAYLLIDLFLGIIPLGFIVFDVVNKTLPSLICALGSGISLIALIVFKDKAMKKELSKRLHI